MSSEDERPRPRAVDENPVGRRADSRRLRPVDDAPLPQKVEKARGLNVIRPGDAVVPTPSTELPPEWLPPKADPTRPPSRRLIPGEHTPAAGSSPTTASTAPTPDDNAAPGLSLVARLRQRPGLVAGAAASAVLLLVLAVGRSGPTTQRSRVFSDAELLALAGVWKSEGATTWGGLTKNAAVAAEVSRVGRSVTAGLGSASDAVVVDTASSAHGFALPDGTVVLTTGLLWRLESEAELAAVIAHLAAHQRLGHVARLVDEPADLAARSRAALAAPKRSADDTALLVAVASAAATAKNSGPDERDADVLAAGALAAAGYDQSALSRLLVRLTAPAVFAAQHPAPPLRVEPLKALPTAGRVDVDHYVKEVLGRLDRVRGPDATPSPSVAAVTVTAPPPVVERAPEPTPIVAPPAMSSATPATTPPKAAPLKKKKKPAPKKQRR